MVFGMKLCVGIRAYSKAEPRALPSVKNYVYFSLDTHQVSPGRKQKKLGHFKRITWPLEQAFHFSSRHSNF
jgi:hypothetical protein